MGTFKVIGWARGTGDGEWPKLRVNQGDTELTSINQSLSLPERVLQGFRAVWSQGQRELFWRNLGEARMEQPIHACRAADSKKEVQQQRNPQKHRERETWKQHKRKSLCGEGAFTGQFQFWVSWIWMYLSSFPSNSHAPCTGLRYITITKKKKDMQD